MLLVKPNKKYAASFWRQFLKRRKEFPGAFKDYGEFKNADDLVRLFRNQEKGKDLPPGWIPHYTYWLIDNEHVIGQSNIRPKLTKFLREAGGQIGYMIFPKFRHLGYGKKILSLTLKKCRLIGMTKALITCDDNNIGSKKIIESNGGILKSKTKMGKGLPDKLVYWIKIKP